MATRHLWRNSRRQGAAWRAARAPAHRLRPGRTGSAGRDGLPAAAPDGHRAHRGAAAAGRVTLRRCDSRSEPREVLRRQQPAGDMPAGRCSVHAAGDVSRSPKVWTCRHVDMWIYGHVYFIDKVFRSLPRLMMPALHHLLTAHCSSLSCRETMAGTQLMARITFGQGVGSLVVFDDPLAASSMQVWLTTM